MENTDNTNKNNSIGEYVKGSIKSFTSSALVKLSMIGIMVLFLLIPRMWIEDLIDERHANLNEAESNIAQTWGKEQTVLGPILMVPYKTVKVIDEKRYEKMNTAYFLPETLQVEGAITPKNRYRGIYNVLVYQSAIQLSGNYKRPDFTSIQPDSSMVLWNKSKVVFNVSDITAIKSDLQLEWDNQSFPIENEIREEPYLNNALVASVDMTNLQASYTFQLSLALNGSKELAFIPVGKTTEVQLEGAWPHPSFKGRYLPDEHNISEKGFLANWKVYHLNRSFPQYWKTGVPDFYGYDIGLSLFEPVNDYVSNYRSIKYAVLTIVLTFLTYFFIEIFVRQKFHLVQYLLTGCSLLIFYILLLSLSEHFGFTSAFVIASFLNIGLIGFYTFGFIKVTKYRLVFIGMLSGLYTYVYAMLQAEVFALLIGSIGLFVVLAIVMIASRKIDWYNLTQNKIVETN